MKDFPKLRLPASLLLATLAIACSPLCTGNAGAQETPPTATEIVRFWINRQDTDGDGKVSKEEASGPLARFFDMVDADRDQFLIESELTRMARRWVERRGSDSANGAKAQASPQNYASDEDIRSRVPEGVRAVLNINYRSGADDDAQKDWQLDLFHPTAATKTARPAILFVHGGGWSKGDKRNPKFIGPAIDYAAMGYVTVSVNYRLTREILPCVEDVKNAVRWLRANADKYHLDVNRIGAYGNSAGAHLVTLLAVSPNVKELEGDGPWREQASSLQAVAASATPTLPRYGTGSDKVKELVAPITHVSSKAPPMLLFHDTSDSTVPVANSDRFVAALKEAGASDVTYKRYTNQSGHAVFTANIAETGPLMKAFFQRTLMDDSRTWAADTELARELTALNTKLTEAYVREDVAELRRMLDDDHVHNNVFGVALSKDQFLGDIESGTLVFESYDTHNLKWRIDGDTAVATGLIRATAKRGGNVVPANEFLFTRVYVRRTDGWKVLLFHNTMVPGK